jgi:hypothetical protein
MQAKASPNSPRLQTISREAFWQRHVTQWRNSGVSRVAYCQQCSLSYHQMVYWIKKVEAAAEGESSSGFVAVAVSTDVRDSGLTLRLPNGMKIEGINDRSIQYVGKLIDQL